MTLDELIRDAIASTSVEVWGNSPSDLTALVQEPFCRTYPPATALAKRSSDHLVDFVEVPEPFRRTYWPANWPADPPVGALAKGFSDHLVDFVEVVVGKACELASERGPEVWAALHDRHTAHDLDQIALVVEFLATHVMPRGQWHLHEIAALVLLALPPTIACRSCGNEIEDDWLTEHAGVRECPLCCYSDQQCIVCGEKILLARVDVGLRTCSSQACHLTAGEHEPKLAEPGWAGHRPAPRHRNLLRSRGHAEKPDWMGGGHWTVDEDHDGNLIFR